MATCTNCIFNHFWDFFNTFDMTCQKCFDNFKYLERLKTKTDAKIILSVVKKTKKNCKGNKE